MKLKFAKITNLQIDGLIAGSFLSGLFYSLAYPSVHYILISEAGQNMISMNAIAVCVSGIIFPTLWNKYSNTLYKKFGFFCNLETALYTIICLIFLLKLITPTIYYVLDTLIFCLVSNNIVCANFKLKANRYNNENAREQYDNNHQLAINISSLLGYILSLVIHMSLAVSFICITIGVCLDNFFYYYVWKHTN